MSENQSQPQHEFQEVVVSDSLSAGIERASKAGFDVYSGLRIDNPSLNDEELNRRKDLLLSTASGMAEEMGFDNDVLDDPVNTIFLCAIADSWISNEDKASNSPYDVNVAREREMLQDTMLILAGRNSQFVRKLADNNLESARMYVDREDLRNQKDDELNSFLDSIEDKRLSDDVEKVLLEFGEGSFLHTQRELLGVTESNEAPFSVKVLRVGDREGLKNVGMLSERPSDPRWRRNSTGLEKLKSKIESDRFNSWNEASKKVAAPYVDAQKEYEDRFLADFGPIQAAMVRTNPDGTKDLMIRAEQAVAVLKSQLDIDMPLENRDLDRMLAIARHEYGHTQKVYARGEQLQIGLLLEERKAEMISGDRNGYMDVKYLFQDLSTTTGLDLLDTLKKSTKEEDPLTAFSVSVANGAGLRTAFLLLASKPVPYENSPSTQSLFPDTGCIKRPKDASTLDALLRESQQLIPREVLKARVAARIGRMNFEKIDIEFYREEGMHYRKAAGINNLNDDLVDALDSRIEQENKSAA